MDFNRLKYACMQGQRRGKTQCGRPSICITLQRCKLNPSLRTKKSQEEKHKQGCAVVISRENHVLNRRLLLPPRKLLSCVDMCCHHVSHLSEAGSMSLSLSRMPPCFCNCRMCSWQWAQDTQSTFLGMLRVLKSDQQQNLAMCSMSAFSNDW